MSFVYTPREYHNTNVVYLSACIKMQFSVSGEILMILTYQESRFCFQNHDYILFGMILRQNSEARE